MGRHSKPTTTHSSTGPLVAVAIATSSTLASIPLASGIANAATVETHPVTEGPPGGWDAIIHCESGGRPDAVNRSSTASGALQFLDSTWRGLGGLVFGRRAKDASLDEQIQIANRAYAESGLTPWTASRSCWRRRIGMGSSSQPSVMQASFQPRRARVGRHRALAQTQPTQPIQTKRYTIRQGDTLSAIAATHGHRWEDVFAENRAVLANPNLLKIGEIINLP